MEEASQDNSQESQEKMQQSHEGASSQESPAVSGKTSPEAGDRELSPDKGGEEEEEEEEEEWPPKFPTTLEGFGYAFNKGTDRLWTHSQTGLFVHGNGTKAISNVHMILSACSHRKYLGFIISVCLQMVSYGT